MSRHRPTRPPPPAVPLGWKPPAERPRRPRPGGWCWPRPVTSSSPPGRPVGSVPSPTPWSDPRDPADPRDRAIWSPCSTAARASTRRGPGGGRTPTDRKTWPTWRSTAGTCTSATSRARARSYPCCCRWPPRPGARCRSSARPWRRATGAATRWSPTCRVSTRPAPRPPSGAEPIGSARCSHPTCRPAPVGWCRGSPRPRTPEHADGQLRPAALQSGGRSGGPARGTSGLRPIAHRRPGRAGPGRARGREGALVNGFDRRHRRHRVRRRGPPPRRPAAVPGRTRSRTAHPSGPGTTSTRSARPSNGSSSPTGGWTTGCSPGGPGSPPPSPSAPACPAADRSGPTWPPGRSARPSGAPSTRRRRPAGSAGRVAGSGRPGPPAWWGAGPATTPWSRPAAAWPGVPSGLSPTSPGGARTTPTCSTAGPVTWLRCWPPTSTPPSSRPVGRRPPPCSSGCSRTPTTTPRSPTLR